MISTNIFLLVATATICVLFFSQSATAQKKVICYYTNWSAYRANNSAFLPKDIDPTLCTHIMYSFATLNPNTLQIRVSDLNLDIDQKFYEQVTALKATSDVKVMIALGGWTDSADSKYSRLVNSPISRATFVSTVVNFIQVHNFDGLDLDWEYPKCWQGDCSAGPDSDKENFVKLVEELKAAFAPHGYLLSSAVAASRFTAEEAYDVPALSAALDWIGVMNYDYHGGWDGVTGHNSPFKGPPPSTEDTIRYFLSKGAAPEKLVMGVPLYGRSFTLENPESNEPGDRATSGAPGEFTGEAGFLAYFEFCSGWTTRNVEDVGPYAFNGDQWVSYDDVAIINKKAEYINDMGLAGAMVWAIDLDDFNGEFCDQGPYPLMKALRAAL